MSCPENGMIALRHQRPVAQEDAEDVLDTSKMEPSAAAAFLQENVPHFVHEHAIEDLAAALDYLSAAGPVPGSPLLIRQESCGFRRKCWSCRDLQTLSAYQGM